MITLVSEPQAQRECPDKPQAGLAASEFADLYSEHSRAIYYLALRFLGDPQKAEDATHDVFLKAFRKMDQFRGESSWRTWLYRIAINHCRNLQQAWHERHVFSNADDVVWENAASKTDSPLRALETKELGERIQKALDAGMRVLGAICLVDRQQGAAELLKEKFGLSLSRSQTISWTNV